VADRVLVVQVNGGKRFIVTDTLGLLSVVVVLAASVQDRDGARTTLLRRRPGGTPGLAGRPLTRYFFT
jgi:hypothetical protein